MGFRYVASHQDDAVTLQRLQRGFPIVAELYSEIVATVTLYPPPAHSQFFWYLQPGVYSLGRFGVRPDLQAHGIGLRLIQCVEQHARDLDATELAIDTAEGALHLRHWYERLGFRFIEYVSWPDTNYRSVVPSKQLTGTA